MNVTPGLFTKSFGHALLASSLRSNQLSAPSTNLVDFSLCFPLKFWLTISKRYRTGDTREIPRDPP